MIRLLLFVFAGYFFLTGLFLLFAPQMFYDITPGVSVMGPYNAHFIRDVSFAFLVSGVAVAYGAAHQIRAVAILGASWPCLHALFHAQIWMLRGFAFDNIWLSDTLGVILPGLLVVLLASKLPPLKR